MTSIESQPFRPTAPATNKCGSSCGYALLNNSGAGYKATASKCVAKLSVVTGEVPNSDYALMWRLSGTSYSCFNDDPDLIHKSFAGALGKTYVFTAYFKPGKAPQSGDPVTLTVDWL